MTCNVRGMRSRELYLGRFHLKASEDTFDAHSGSAAVGRFSRMACTVSGSPCRTRRRGDRGSGIGKMASVKKRRLWTRKMDLWGGVPARA